jgi:hypothetical protein
VQFPGAVLEVFLRNILHFRGKKAHTMHTGVEIQYENYLIVPDFNPVSKSTRQLQEKKRISFVQASFFSYEIGFTQTSTGLIYHFFP